MLGSKITVHHEFIIFTITVFQLQSRSVNHVCASSNAPVNTNSDIGSYPFHIGVDGTDHQS